MNIMNPIQLQASKFPDLIVKTQNRKISTTPKETTYRSTYEKQIIWFGYESAPMNIYGGTMELKHQTRTTQVEIYATKRSINL